ncbi:HNH endonuclease [Vibrio harveyi]|nr:HNH endonuclease [Vibrio harveyi]
MNDRIQRLQELRKKAIKQEQISQLQFQGIVEDCSRLLESLEPTKRKLWLVDVLNEMYLEQQSICPLCGTKMEYNDFEVDHIIPIKWGGGNESSNIQLVHAKCNRDKGSRVSPSDLLRYLEDRFQNLRC